MRKIILPIIMLLSMLSAKSYNTPFINVDETIQLKEGMTKQQVLNTIGDPFYVDSGDMGIIVWIYEVRAIEVQSDSPVGEDVIPNKTHKNYKHTGPIHRLEVVFVDNRLESWQMIEQKIKKKSLPSVALPKPKAKSLSIAISPHFQIGSGVGAGLSIYKGNLGVGVHFNGADDWENEGPNYFTQNEEYNEGWWGNDYEYSYTYTDIYRKSEVHTTYSSFTIMGKFKKTIKSIILELSLGSSTFSGDTETTYQYEDEDGMAVYSENWDEWDSGEYESTSIYASIGVGKNFSIKGINLQPMIQAGIFNEDFGISAQCKFNFML